MSLADRLPIGSASAPTCAICETPITDDDRRRTLDGDAVHKECVRAFQGVGRTLRGGRR